VSEDTLHIEPNRSDCFMEWLEYCNWLMWASFGIGYKVDPENKYVKRYLSRFKNGGKE